MAYLLDTDVAIHLRNRDPFVIQMIAKLAGPPFLSVLSQVEMEGGVYTKAPLAAERRLSLNTLLATVTVLPFGPSEAEAYGRIVAALGFSRRKVADRMIAATALIHDLTLITMNGRDFANIPGLRLEVWSRPSD